MRAPIVASLVHPMVRTIGEGGARRYFGPSLSLDFLEQQYCMGRAGTYPPQRLFGDLITFARSTTAMRRNSLGLLEAVAANQPRFNYDADTLATSSSSVVIGPGSKIFAVGRQFTVGETVRATANSTSWVVGKVTAATASSVTIAVVRGFAGSGTFTSWTLISVLGLLIEEQRTNLCLYSDYINWVPWVGQLGATETTIPAPDGTFTATRLNYAGVSQTYQPITVTPSTQYTFSYYVRLGTKPSNLYAVYDQTNSAFLVAAAVNASATTSRWTRFSVTFTTPANCTQVRIYPERADNTGTLGTVYIWRVQLEAGAFATSPIGTTSAQVTRAADWVTSAIGQWYNTLEGALVLKATLLSRTGATRVSVDVGSVGGNFGTTLYTSHTSGGDLLNPSTAPLNLSSSYTNTTLSVRFGIGFKQNNSIIVSPTAKGALDTTCEIPAAPNRLTLGAAGWGAGGGSYLNGHLRSLDYYPRRLPDADLQTLAAA